MNDGGPAFPMPFPPRPNLGMSLRQWYAGLAMQGMLASERYDNATRGEIAMEAFLQADEMLSIENYLAKGRDTNATQM